MRRIIAIVLCALAAPLVASHAGDDPIAWLHIETRGDMPREDLRFTQEAVAHAATELGRYFDDPALSDALRRIDARVILHATPGDVANETTASARSGTRDGTVDTYFIEIHILAPSAHAPDLLTSIGESKDEAYFQRLIAHELSTAPLELTTRLKTEGWMIRSAPDWFVQGYQEYLGMICAAPPHGAAALDRRTRIVIDEPDRVDDAFGLNVSDPYVTGAVLLRFMHEQYGADAVRGILTSNAPSFGRAVRTALDVDLEQFMTDWRAWLAQKNETLDQ